mmetsp:Transcript_461/g.1153  ORF Transcript_461/g.1153 Transcript_461/m.1153 type:complete len:363 (+) Transcript_461:676-1764(+)
MAAAWLACTSFIVWLIAAFSFAAALAEAPLEAGRTAEAETLREDGRDLLYGVRGRSTIAFLATGDGGNLGLLGLLAGLGLRLAGVGAASSSPSSSPPYSDSDSSPSAKDLCFWRGLKEDFGSLRVVPVANACAGNGALRGKGGGGGALCTGLGPKSTEAKSCKGVSRAAGGSAAAADPRRRGKRACVMGAYLSTAALVGYKRMKLLQRVNSCRDRASNFNWDSLRVSRATGSSETTGALAAAAAFAAAAAARRKRAPLALQSDLERPLCTGLGAMLLTPRMRFTRSRIACLSLAWDWKTFARQRDTATICWLAWQTPMRLKASLSRELFTCQSSGESACMLGLRFTSKIHGFKSSSTSTSKP